MQKDLAHPQRIRGSDISAAVRIGLATFRSIPKVSMAYTSLFAAIGLMLFTAVGQLGVSPMALPLAGGFLLVGPAILAGFFRLFERFRDGKTARLPDAYGAFAQLPAGLWIVALICSLLFIIWITDAAVLYSFMIGGEHLPYEIPWLIRLQRHVVQFELWAALMGSVLAYIIFCISAFSVPLLFARRCGLVEAISASVRASVRNFLPAIGWGLLLSLTIIWSILLLPLLLLSLPVLAYASYALYLQVFPEGSADNSMAPTRNR